MVEYVEEQELSYDAGKMYNHFGKEFGSLSNS